MGKERTMSSKGQGSNNSRGLELAFITFSDKNALKDPVQQQIARTQAIKNSLQRKRHQLQSANENFVDETQSVVKRGKRRITPEEANEVDLPKRSASLASSIVDPFSCIAVDASRLSFLLQHNSARQAGDPVFSVNSPIEFQGLRSVFNAGLEDPGLASAVCLALAFAANGGIMDQECTAYRLKAIQHVNETLSDPAQAASTTTIGTVLLLVGVEGRLGERETAQMHLNGTRQLLMLSNERKISINHAVRRAIFWQDLFTSMIAGTDRVFSHDMFPEIHWHRDPFSINLYSIPQGFGERRHILGEEFMNIIGDIRALQHLRENSTTYPIDNLDVEKIDNQQAWIESRLEQLRHVATEPLLRCSIPAAYLCAYGCFTDIWSGHLIPSRVTAYLLEELRATESWAGWDDHADLLLWLLHIGIAFAEDKSVRLGVAGMLHGSHRARLQPMFETWEDTERTLKRFIWSDIVHRPRCERFWNRLHDL